MAVERLYMAFFQLKNPCIPMKTELECFIPVQFLIGGVSGFIMGQTGLLIERACATFMKDYEKKKSLMIGCLISFIVFVLSYLTGRIVIWDDPLTSYQLACNTFPKESQDRSGLFFIACTIVSLFNLLMSFLIRKYNKKFEYSTQFVVGPRFRKREVIDSTSTICFIAFVQFIFMFIYSFGLSMMRIIKDDLTTEQYYFWVVWLNTLPFTAAILPALLIYRIRYSRIIRVSIIKKFTNTKQTQEEHINQMKNIWN